VAFVVSWLSSGARRGSTAQEPERVAQRPRLITSERGESATIERMRGAVAILACVSVHTAAAHADPEARLRRSVLAAIGKRDTRAFGEQLADKPLRLYHVWFDTAACAREFGGKVTVKRANLPELVSCLARLGLAESGGALVHAPGVAVVPLLYRGKLAGLSGVAVEASVPTVSDAALAANLVAGKLDVPPDAATRTAIDRAKQGATVWLEACVDPAGKVEKISTRKRSSELAAPYAKSIEAAAAGWTFRPFKRAGKAVRVCLQRRYAYPADQ